MRKTTILLLLALGLAPPVSAARRQIDETHRADPRGEVTVELLAGTVRVEAWDRNEVRLTGSIDDEYEELEVEAEGGDVSISVDTRDGRYEGSRSGARLELRVPSEARLEIEVVSGDIEVVGLRGEATVEAISGDVELRGEMIAIEVECVSGNVRIEASPALRRASLETVSGDLDLRGTVRDGRFNLESVNGDITLRLDADSSAHFDIETFNGDIRNELGPKARRSSEYLPSKQLSFTLGAGDARVTIESFNGKVELLRQ